ncbi:FixH family protein [Paenibacillus shirakamiensis]|nr:FixH family protein [Paenibacillus shirakamiensis]
MQRVAGLLTISALLLSGCNSSSNDMNHDMMSPLNVNLTVTPDVPTVNNKIRFEANVMQDGKAVDQAKEVAFEIWKDGSDQHSKTPVKSAGAGIYVLEKTFNEPGTYHVISHVTANSMHAMPSADFQVK